MRVYFDNAATTPLDPDVLEAMLPYMKEHYGNPSSIHFHGRETRSAIEKARKTVADLLNTSPAEIFFTSGGTEADNMALHCTIENQGIQHVITSRIEHHAVLHTLEILEKKGQINLSFVALDERGQVVMDDLERLLKENPKSLVSLMHANNEIANISPIDAFVEMCRAHQSIFHSDTVQTMGHYKHDLQQLKAHCIVGSAHKFHGPKGVGFIYIHHDHKIHPYIQGGGQERNMRGGTENLYGIIGLAKALEIAYQDMNAHHEHIQGLKTRMIHKLKDSIPQVAFNGHSERKDSLYTVLNVCLPASDINEMLLFNLDIHQISVSGGSACSSGANEGSHVLSAIETNPDCGAVRLSFSKFNTEEEVDYVAEKLNEIYTVKA